MTRKVNETEEDTNNTEVSAPFGGATPTVFTMSARPSARSLCGEASEFLTVSLLLPYRIRIE
jgi:hypothetical protein